MAGNDSLTTRQRKFVAALLATRTIEEAAIAAGISERTAYRYLQKPAIKRALGQTLDAVLGQVSRRVVKEMGSALDTLKEIHEKAAEKAAPRVSAARAILDAGPRLREALDLADRVAELERQVEKNTKGEES
jgi:phage terminase small subunit